MVHAGRGEIFSIGGHAFDARDVCARGKFRGREGAWDGPPRHHLAPKFARWAEHLAAGAEASATATGGAAALEHSLVQTKGGYQNAFVFAERGPPTAALWGAIARARAAGAADMGNA